MPSKKTIEKKPKEKAAKEAHGPCMVFCEEERPKIVLLTSQTPAWHSALGATWSKLSDAQKAKCKK
jgi:hypothetical protein